jgi:hypothetical protein
MIERCARWTLHCNQSNNPNMERPVAYAVVMGVDRVLPATAAPSSIHVEMRANNSMGPIQPTRSPFGRGDATYERRKDFQAVTDY